MSNFTHPVVNGNGGYPHTPSLLMAHHAAQLEACGLTAATIIQAGFYSLTDPDRLRALMNNAHLKRSMLPALVIPYPGTDGYARLRPDHPRMKDGKPIKYEAPIGQSNRLYLPLACTDLLLDCTVPLMVAEGEKKALAAAQHGYACVGIAGVYGWCVSGHEALLPELCELPLRDRQVCIVFDSDVQTNPRVQNAESRLARALMAQSARVSVVRLPPGPADHNGLPSKLGLDDFLASCGENARAELGSLLEAAIDPTPVAPIVEKTPATKADPAELARSYREPIKERLRYWNGEYYWFNGKYYSHLPNDELRSSVMRDLNEKHTHVNRNVTANVLQQLQAQTIMSAEISPPAIIGQLPGEIADWNARDTLHLDDGVVNLRKLCVEEDDHFAAANPAFFALSCTSYCFPRTAVGCPGWLNFLNSLFGSDSESIELLQEWMGICLSGDTAFQKILLIIGPRRSGKGTIARVLTELVGRPNVVSPTLSSLVGNFGLWPWIGKSLAIFADARLSSKSDQAPVIERLLSISGEDLQTVDRKNLPQVTTKLAAHIMLITNEIPLFYDASAALASRMLVLKLHRSFEGQEDANLTSRLLVELPGIFRWAVAGLTRLLQRGRFRQAASTEAMRSVLAELTSPILVFLDEDCVVDPLASVEVSRLWQAWERWCERHNHVRGTSGVFGRNLHAAIPGLQKSRIRPNSPSPGDRSYVYRGLRLRWDAVSGPGGPPDPS